MNKTTRTLILLIIFGFVGFFIYSKVTQKKATVSEPISTITPTSQPAPLSPIFSSLSTWVKDASWSTPTQKMEETDYGTVKGMMVEGEMKGTNKSIKRNYEDVELMKTWGFTEDMNFAADGPGASNWGYKKIDEKGMTQIAIFRYSTNRLLGPDSKSEAFVNLSVFVSDPFIKK